MKRFWGLWIAVILASGIFAGSAAYAASCEVWKQDCARFYGWGNINWQNCMGQPGAIAACSGGY